MASLTGSSIASSYTSLLKLNGNTDTLVGAGSDTAIQVVDGDGTGSALYLNTDGIGIGATTVQQLLHLEKDDADVGIAFTQTGQRSWSFGIDNSDSDRLKIGYSSTIGTNTVATFTESGQLGIGATPSYPLTISKAESAPSDFQTNLDIKRTWDSGDSTDRFHGLIFSDSNSVGAGIFMNRYASHANYNSTLMFYINDSGSSSPSPSTALGDPNFVIDLNSRISLSNNDNNTDNTVFGKSAFNVGTNDNDSDRNVAIGNLAMGTGTVAGAQNNTAIGHQALTDITNADRNVAIGASVAPNITEGERNTVIGADALGLSTIASKNVAIGNLAMYASPASVAVADCVAIGYYALGDGTHTTGANYSVAIGSESLKNATQGGNNVACGYQSGKALTTGNQNVILGGGAMSGGIVTGDNNVAVGAGAGYNMTSGHSNVIVGKDAGVAVTEGTHNVAIGLLSLQALTTAHNNVAVGSNAMLNATSLTQSVAVGRQAMGLGVATGSGNIAIGYASLYDITSGENNIGIGSSALGNVLGGDSNVAIGHQAGENLTSGGNSVMIGNKAGEGVSTSFYHVLIGDHAGNKTLTDHGTTAVGYYALANATSGGYNTAIGYQSLEDNVSGEFNTAVGYQTLKDATNDKCTAVGYQAGDTTVGATKSTFIGYDTAGSGANVNNETVIGADAVGKGANSVTLGNGDVTDVYMAQDSGATVHAGGLDVDNGTGTVNRGNSSGDIFEARGLNASQMKITTSAFTVTPNATFTGSIAKASSTFKIDHPLEAKKDTHYLVHSVVESPQVNNIYRGKATLSSGSVEINLDTVSGMSEGTFVLLNTDIQCFTSNESDWDAVKGSVSGNILTISCQNTDSTADVSWLVIGERQDDHIKETDWTDENGKVIVEPEKNN